jgi:DNA phosphorothioation-dependent restriction protein DptG
MTWVEGLVLLSVAAALGGFIQRRTRTGRVLMWVTLLLLATLLLIFGRELVSDLL